MMLNRPSYSTPLCPPVMCRDANARVTADIVRSAECSRADASSWLKVRSTLNSLYLSHSLDCVTYRVAFTRHSLPLSLSPYVQPFSLSLNLLLFLTLSSSLYTLSLSSSSPSFDILILPPLSYRSAIQ